MAEQHHSQHAEHLRPVEHEPQIDHKVETEHSYAHHEAARQDALETSREQIDQLAGSSESVKIGEHIKEPADQVVVNKELKELAYARILTRTRKNLPLADKWLSKLTHQPVVDKVSILGEKTIARPLGVLAGSILALVGSGVMLYSAKHYGFRYNFLVFLLLFGGGYALGLLLELALVFVKKTRH